MKEGKSCIHPFIRRTQWVLSRDGSLKTTLDQIPLYQKRAASIYKIDVYLPHAIAVSRLGLSSIIFYEYIRYRGAPLPDLIQVVDAVMPAKLYSERVLLKQKPDPRHQEMEKAFG